MTGPLIGGMGTGDVGALKRSLSTLRRGRFQHYDCAWFADVPEHDRRNEGERIATADGVLSAVVEQFDVVKRDVRGFLELGRIHCDAERRRHQEQVDDILCKVTAALLVPTLVSRGVRRNNAPCLWRRLGRAP